MFLLTLRPRRADKKTGKGNALPYLRFPPVVLNEFQSADWYSLSTAGLRETYHASALPTVRGAWPISGRPRPRKFNFLLLF